MITGGNITSRLIEGTNRVKPVAAVGWRNGILEIKPPVKDSIPHFAAINTEEGEPAGF